MDHASRRVFGSLYALMQQHANTSTRLRRKAEGALKLTTNAALATLVSRLFTTQPCSMCLPQLGKSWPGRPGQVRPGQAQARPGQARPGQAQARPGPGQARPGQARPGQAKPSQAKPSQAKPSQAKPSQASQPGRHMAEMDIRSGEASGEQGGCHTDWLASRLIGQ